MPGAEPRNIVVVLADDHRFDAMVFAGHPFLETSNLDRLARDGVHLGEHLPAWEEAEQAHFARDDTRARADLVIDGTEDSLGRP